jgi:hypothetical protein
MAFDVTSLLCPFTVMSHIFMLKKGTVKTHCENVGFNVLDNAPLAIYQAALARHWLVMDFKIDSSSIDARLSNMEVAIENIVSFMTVGNLAINQLIEHEAATVVTIKPASAEEPKWTTLMAKNVRQVVN